MEYQSNTAQIVCNGGYIQVRKTQKCIESQMIINSISLPDVLIDLVKDYMYYDELSVISRAKNQIVLKELNSKILEEIYLIDEFNKRKLMIFDYWSIGISPRIRGCVCVQCGNYYDRDPPSRQVIQQIRCNCDHDNDALYYEENDILHDHYYSDSDSDISVHYYGVD